MSFFALISVAINTNAMWKETLPLECPPSAAVERNEKMFRVISEKDLLATDFDSHAANDWERYKHLCDFCGVSFFNTVTNMVTAYKIALSRDRNLGNYIAELEIKESHGKSTFKKKNGHFNVWFYDTWELKAFPIISLYDTDGNRI